MKKYIIFGFTSLLTLLLSGCASTTEVKIVVDDLTVKQGMQVSEQEVINNVVKHIEVHELFPQQYNSSIKGLDSIDWNTPASYNMRFELCNNNDQCFSENFEINVVHNLADDQHPRDFRKVFIDTTDIDVPLGTRLSSSEIIDKVTIEVIDSDDQAFSQSLSITGLSDVDFDQPGIYKITIGGCDRQLNCHQADTYIHVIEGISKVRIHNYST